MQPRNVDCVLDCSDSSLLELENCDSHPLVQSIVCSQCGNIGAVLRENRDDQHAKGVACVLGYARRCKILITDTEGPAKGSENFQGAFSFR